MSFQLPVIPTANLILWHCSNSQSALRSNLATASTSVTDFASGPILARPRRRDCMRTAKIGLDLRFSNATLVTCIPVYLKTVSPVKLSKPANLSESLNWHLNLPVCQVRFQSCKKGSSLHCYRQSHKQCLCHSFFFLCPRRIALAKLTFWWRWDMRILSGAL